MSNFSIPKVFLHWKTRDTIYLCFTLAHFLARCSKIPSESCSAVRALSSVKASFDFQVFYHNTRAILVQFKVLKIYLMPLHLFCCNFELANPEQG